MGPYNTATFLYFHKYTMSNQIYANETVQYAYTGPIDAETFDATLYLLRPTNVSPFATQITTAATTNRSTIFPDASGNILLDAATQNIYNKTIDAATNTISTGTKSVKFDPSPSAVNTLSTLAFSSTAPRTFTYPDTTGTVALTSDIPSTANFVTTDTFQSIVAQKTFTAAPSIATILNSNNADLPIVMPNNSASGDQFVTTQADQIMTNKHLNAELTRLYGNTGTNRYVNFSLATASNTTTLTLSFAQTANRTITFPDATTTLASTDSLQNITNKRLFSGSTWFVNDADTTKSFTILNYGSTGTSVQLQSAPTASRIIELPDATTVLVGTNVAQTLTNKTIAYGSNTITGLPVSSTGYAAYYVLNNTSISNVSDTIVPYDTAIATDSGISNSSGTFTINTSGTYNIVATVGYLVSGAGFRRSYIMLNSSGIQYGQNRIPGSASYDGFMVSSFTANLTAGDTIKVMTLQSSGGNLTLIGYNGFAGTSTTMVQITRIS
jgi:hypothetical protein